MITSDVQANGACKIQLKIHFI
uniref:Uncharacterized protein n=1 Tax=Arundo donax TaxID=35708 RepID=A0A0A8YLQ1_ARUDO